MSRGKIPRFLPPATYLINAHPYTSWCMNIIRFSFVLVGVVYGRGKAQPCPCHTPHLPTQTPLANLLYRVMVMVVLMICMLLYYLMTVALIIAIVSMPYTRS